MKRFNQRLVGAWVCAGLLPLAAIGCGEKEIAAPEAPVVDIASITPVSSPQWDPQAPTQVAQQSNNALAFSMYRQLIEQGDEGENLFFSPVSISAALMLTYEGARGQTQTELQQVLSLDDTERIDAHRAYAGVLGRLSGEDAPYELTIANALWAEKTMPLRSELVQTLRAHYEASLESVDFIGDYENQRQLINTWVMDRTQDRISDLLPEDSLDTDTRVVLVNAIYFKADWLITFSEYATRDEAFYLLPGAGDTENASVSVPMMRQSLETYSYGDFEGYDALTIFYEGRDLSMLVLLPDENDGLSQLEASLSPELIDETVAAMDYETVNLRLPKWEMTLDYDLIPALQGMGMQTAFDRRADLTGFSDSPEADRLFISGVFHKAFIAVDENGTEAAAATAVTVTAESAFIPQEDPIEFVADHPFVYLIRDNRTGAILFIGRVTDPS